MQITNDPAGYTKNYSKRGDGSPLLITPKGVMLHHGGGTKKSDLYILRGNDPKRKVSSGWYICKTGEIIQLGPENQHYWHAGIPDRGVRTWWGNDAYAFGIIDGNMLFGVETEHRDGEIWPTKQLQAINDFGRHYTQKYNFSLTSLGAHRWYAPSRKHDPGDLSDTELRRMFQSWVAVRAGKMMKVTAPSGAYIRQGPGVEFPIAAAIEQGATYWESQTVVGSAPPNTSNHVWSHYGGPSKEVVAELGFIWSGIVVDA
jgi:N-acetyl-anhydromuramyl-L-alanine amidase AmpD